MIPKDEQSLLALISGAIATAGIDQVRRTTSKFIQATYEADFEDFVPEANEPSFELIYDTTPRE
jgi:hypothetical protein